VVSIRYRRGRRDTRVKGCYGQTKKLPPPALGEHQIASSLGPPEVTGDQMVAAMDAVGVDGAVLVSPFSMYRYDASYAKEVYAAHPDRFGLVKPIDPTDPAVADGDGFGRHGWSERRRPHGDNVLRRPAPHSAEARQGT
jgi:hypothetical protein